MKAVTTLVADAIDVLSQLPEDAQEIAARAIIEYANGFPQEP